MTKKPFLNSFLFTSLCFGLVLFLFKPYFTTDDDPFTIFVTKGMGIALHPSEYIFWLNILVGLGLKNLYAAMPEMPWHGLLLFSTLFVGFWALLLSFLYSGNSRLKIILFAICFVGIDIHFLINPHFSITALLAFEGGFFLLMSLRENKIESIPALALANACFFLSALVRIEAFCLGILLITPIFIYEISKKQKPFFDKKTLTAFITTSALILSSLFANHFLYQKNKTWNDFLSYNSTFGHLISFRYLEYDENQKAIYDDIHWTKNDLDLFRNWYLLDKDKYSYENLKKLDHSIPLSDLDKKNNSQPFSQIFTSPIAQTIYLFSLCLIAFLSFRKAVTVFLMMLWVLLIHSYLFYFMKSPPWLFEPLLVFIPHLCVSFSLPFHVDKEEKNLNPIVTSKTSKSLILGLLITSSFFIGGIDYFVNQSKQKSEKDLKYFIHQLNPQPNQLYITWHNTIPYEGINAFDSFDEFKNFNIFALHEFQRTPVGQEMLDHFGIKFLFAEMVDNPNLFMICTPTEGALYSKYMFEKYHWIIVAKNVFDCPYFHVYRITSLKK
jgi:hypothetical protein